MKKKVILSALCFLFLGLLPFEYSLCHAQEGMTGYTEDENIEYLPKEEIRATLQQLKSLRTTLPEKVDNGTSTYMPRVFNQDGGSCGSASRISYMLAYELNNYRGLKGQLRANMYPSHFTWLLEGQGSSKEGMAIFNGIPTVGDYCGTSGRTYSPILGGNVPGIADIKNSSYGWMQGYDKWRRAMNNRLEKTINIIADDDEALEYIKWWIYNHHGDESFNAGGVVGGPAATTGWVAKRNKDNLYYISSYGPQIDHGIVFCGYDDTIWCDLNGDNSKTSNEVGALILQNSWGTGSHNNGFVYVPYSLVKSYNGGLSMELYYIRKDYEPVDVFRIKMDYSERCNLKLSIGISDDLKATAPTKTIAAEHFKYAGNKAIPMLGEHNGTMNSDPMEFGLDLTDLSKIGFNTKDKFRYFLIVETASGSTGTGTVHELQVIRHKQATSGTVATLTAPVSITGGGKKIIIPLDVQGTTLLTPSEYLYVPKSKYSVRSATSEQSESPKENVLDGDESTYWHSRWSGGSVVGLPHTIIFYYPEGYEINGFEYLPRQDHSNGRIGDYVFEIYDATSKKWITISEGTFENNNSVKQVFFDPITTTNVSMVRLRNLKAANGDSNTCMAEFNLFYKPKTEGPNSTDILEQDAIKIRKSGTFMQISGAQGNTSFAIYDTSGNIAVQKTADVSSETITKLDISNLSKGVYILKVVSQNQVKTTKFTSF